MALKETPIVLALHSKYGASSSARFMACAGSMVLSRGKRNTSSKYADEGTAAHELSSWCLADWTADKQASGVWPLQASAFLGRIIQAGEREFEVDDDMVADVQQYVDNIAEYALGADAVLVEVKVNYSRFIGCEPDDGWGTSDVVILKGSEIQVHDLKYGRGEQVEVEENSQCKLYALGAYEQFNSLAGDYDTARMVIHQVRKDPRPQEWDCTTEHLLVFADEVKVALLKIADAEEHFDGGDMELTEWESLFLNPGEKQCRWCKAYATCPAARNVVATTVGGAEASTPADFLDLDESTMAPAVKSSIDDWLSACMGKADFVENWLKAVREEMAQRLNDGVEFAEWKLVQGKKGNRKWADVEVAEATLKSFRLKADEMYTKKVISPAAAEKMLKDQPKRWNKAKELITQSEGGIHVAPMSDKREALKVVPIADQFPDLDHADSEQPGADNFDDLA